MSQLFRNIELDSKLKQNIALTRSKMNVWLEENYIDLFQIYFHAFDIDINF